MEPFSFDDEDLLEFYNLKSLDPTGSWKVDSSVLLPDENKLAKWESVELTMANSYEILKDLISHQQQLHNYYHNNSNSLGNDFNSIFDPLNNEEMSNSFQKLHLDDEALTHYMINSKKFNVQKFLRDIHSTDSFNDLTKSLDNLDSIIKDQEDNLKHLVQSNFTKYVKIKNRLDLIYKQFSESNNSNLAQLSEKVDESIRATTLTLKPLLDTTTRISNFKMARDFIEENRAFFNVPKTLKNCLERKDYTTLTSEYLKAKELYEQFKESAVIDSDIAMPSDNEEDEDSSRTISNKKDNVPKIVEMIWSQVEKIIESYRKQMWESLIGNDNTMSKLEIESQDYVLPLISKLLDLNVDENPIIKWLYFKLDLLETTLVKTSQHLLMKIIKVQKQILKISIDENDDLEGVDLSYYLSIDQLLQLDPINLELENGRNRGNSPSDSSHQLALSTYSGLTDSPTVVDMWLLILRYINELKHICTKFIELWEHVEKFLDGTYQSILINEKKKDNILVGNVNVLDNFKRFLILQKDQVNDIRNRGQKFIKLTSGTLSFFLHSTQASLSEFDPDKISINGLHEEAEMTKRKDTGIPTDYGFIPPRANGLSCLRYLPKITDSLLKFVTQLAQLSISPETIEISRDLASIAITRCIGAISSTRLRDTSNFYKLENWDIYRYVQSPGDNQDGSAIEYGVTQFPEIVLTVQHFSIKTIRDIVFSFEKFPVLNNVSVVGYPSKQLLTGIELQQIISMEAVLEAILKNAAKDKDNPRNSKTVLTLTNLQYIKDYTFPTILQYFDDSFDLKLETKPLEIFNLLNKMGSSIFGNYLSDLKIHLRDILEVKFQQINWPNYKSTSFRINDYIIEALMLLVTVHSECYKIGPQLINKILKETQIFISRYLFEAFKSFIGNLSSDGLLQATVDLKFFQRVLGSLLEKDTAVTLTACLQNCFQNNIDRMNKCIEETEPIVTANLKRTSVQFSAFR
ncbi:hypothetical protein KAFR_0B05900 [Kazachstania africana CBS 2517]|uniref:Exocyst complex component SEC5 n=1 Tax=Kazachstania africana (strain ATCC 22294 / BCRC 22015 / CBS 2517 / CECT 1963 / NBRC 1671 / NRRL Y-8276) TaxID=1071382 RepID=H2AR86_KAZAF|nr:hypothetical protein KAFR_0B05900 [Kazachstania africana CBS 2517]CCF56886.1 hypothetical protein KAFR_0B05900 [Kazachstania africana CBS 2517]